MSNKTAPSSVARDLPVDDRIKLIADKLDGNDFAEEVPGLKKLLDDYIDPTIEVDKVDFHRRLLAVFRDSGTDNTYQHLLERHTNNEKERVERFVDGEKLSDVSQGFVMGPSLGAREEMQKFHEANRVEVSAAGPVHVGGLSDDELKEKDGLFHKFVHGLAKLFHHHEDDKFVTVYKDVKFWNSGLNIENVPQYTCVPTTAAGVVRIVKFAKENDMSVRCSGYRHSWAPIFGRNGQILISTISLKAAAHLPNKEALPFTEPEPTELESIEIVPGIPRQKGNSLVRLGCAVTNERLRRWCVKNNKVTLPINIIIVEITLGGSNAPICHGAGRRHQTLSDLVRSIEYIDANGNLKIVKNPEHLRAASGCFGLMGVITHLTLEFSPMTYAEMKPVKMPMIKAIPPPPDMKDVDIPNALFIPRSPEEKQNDQEAFEQHATNDYYAEWIWFPFSDYVWVNCWNNTADSSDVVDFPDHLHIFLSFVETFTMQVLQSTPLLLKLITATHLSEAAVTLFSRAAMFALPDHPVKTYLTDGLHFQRAATNLRVRDLEVEMPLQPKKGQPDTPDLTLARRAWWDAVCTVYKAENLKTCPMRMPLEMRIIGDSGVVLAPVRYNKLGTCSIEVLTLQSAAPIWNAFAQQVVDKWMSYTDASGKRLNTRPHWAKEWYDFKVDGRPWKEKLKHETYVHEIREFKEVLTAIGVEHGWTLADLKRMFSNDFFDGLIFDDVEPLPKTKI